MSGIHQVKRWIKGGGPHRVICTMRLGADRGGGGVEGAGSPIAYRPCR